MKFDELDKRMRVYETLNDVCVLPGIYIVARLDGRGFTRLTKEIVSFDAPFDERFRDAMVTTCVHLMDVGIRIVFAYTQSDEISLLFERDESTFGRKIRKLNSVLAGEASARLSLLLGSVAVFDCRICQLPSAECVADYFRWRSEDAGRNALNAHCYWMYRRQGFTASEATSRLSGMSTSAKNELLFANGVNFNELPDWQKRGVGLRWESYEKTARNPMTGDSTTATRRRIRFELQLPMKDAYSTYVAELIE
ncbi:MAG: guanylyltransferase [Phycisphaerales bacterium]|nr:guanylyltransferase [Phycisphaerales bacterium]